MLTPRATGAGSAQTHLCCIQIVLWSGRGDHTQERPPWPCGEAKEACGVFRRVISLLVLLSGSEQPPNTLTAHPRSPHPHQPCTSAGWKFRRAWVPSCPLALIYQGDELPELFGHSTLEQGGFSQTVPGHGWGEPRAGTTPELCPGSPGLGGEDRHL